MTPIGPSAGLAAPPVRPDESGACDSGSREFRFRTPGGIPGRIPVRALPAPADGAAESGDPVGWALRIEHSRLKLLRGFDELLCLDGLRGVEHFPHQIETVRRVLRYFRGRVLLADEVGLGKTIEACLLLREFLLRGLVRRVLILVPAPLASQWREELDAKFGLAFDLPDGTPAFWSARDRVLSSMALAKSRRHFAAVSSASWDLVIVDEAHHCKNRATLNWKLVNALQRRHLFLLTATPVQNDLVEMYNLLTLLEPGHLKTEADFKRNYVARGNPRDPKNREKLRELLGAVMIRNTRSLVNINLPPRYAQTFRVAASGAEAALYRDVEDYLRRRRPEPAGVPATGEDHASDPADPHAPAAADPRANGGDGSEPASEPCSPAAQPCDRQTPAPNGNREARDDAKATGPGPLSRMRINQLLMAAGSHPAALAPMLARVAEDDPAAAALAGRARACAGHPTAKEEKLLALLRERPNGKTLVFACFIETLVQLENRLRESGMSCAVFSGRQTAAEKDAAVARFRESAPVLLCSESGGEGRNLQFADTLVNFDLPWNPMRIEQRIGRIHRIGQTREVFVFNLCAANTLEARVLSVLDDKIRMFELVVGEVGGILGNLDGGEEFESLVLDLWLKAASADELDRAFDDLGEKLLGAQREYLDAKKLDDALFGDDFD